MVDIAVIGGGPAGLSAAINGTQRNKSVTVFGRGIESSFIYKAEDVDNYLGMPHVSGADMMKAFHQHAVSKGVLFQEGRVLQIFPMGESFTINVENEFYEAKTIVLAIGLPRVKAIKGEEALLGKGVSYCATCDGMLYRRKPVVVVSDSEEGVNDANFLNEICEKVTYIVRKAGEQEKNLHKNIEVIESRPTEVLGREVVSGIRVGERQIDCKGIFFIRETAPINSLLAGLEMEDSAIKVNRFMETNVPGVFAAGDCTGRPYQVSKAVGEGLIAGQQAVKVLSDKVN